MINNTLLPNQPIPKAFLLSHARRIAVIPLIILHVLCFISCKLSAQAQSQGSKSKTIELFEAIRSGDTSKLKQQLAGGSSANDSLYGYTALMAATLNGSVEEMKILIDHGANVNDQTIRGATALWLAVPDWDKTILLLEHGADVQHKVEGYGILVKLAAIPGSIKLFRLLMDKGADPRKSSSDNLLLYNAGSGGDTAIIGLLLRTGLNPNDKSSFGDYPISAALNYRNFGAVKMFVEHGADVNVQPTTPTMEWFTGFTPLIFAALSDDKASFYYLLDHGSNTNLKTKKGYTALMLLQQSEYDDPEMTLALIKHGAIISEKAMDGTDALYYAKRKGNTQSVELLNKYANK
jgi:ankyrin repeat protein